MSESWDGERVTRWIRQSEGLERQLAPVSAVLLGAAELRPGEVVLDVGCGTGPTTWAAARAVGAGGRVYGLDVSAEMLAAAAKAPVGDPGALAPVDWITADAVTWTPEGGASFDVVLSRFGVMFFSDSASAFAHLAEATRPGRGRLAVAVWAKRDESALFAVPLHAAVGALRARGLDRTTSGVSLDDFLADDESGPFSLHDPTSLTDLLTSAGWEDVRVSFHLLPLLFAGGVSPAVAGRAALDFGPTRALLVGLDDSSVAAAEAAIVEAFAGNVDDDGQVVLSGAVRLVTALRSQVTSP